MPPETAEERNPLIRHMSAIRTLSQEEKTFLLQLQETATSFPAQTTLIRQGAPFRKAYIVISGWVLRYRILEDGRRHIIDFGLPGEPLCVQAYLFPKSGHDIITLTDTRLAAFPIEQLGELHQHFPKLAATMFWTSGQADGILAEKLMSVARRNAYERVGHFLSEIWHRLNVLDLTEGDRFLLPLNQEIIADALGLSLVHVNRTLMRLRREGLIEIEKNPVTGITIPDRSRLELASKFHPDYLHYRKPEDSAPGRRLDAGQPPRPRRPA